MTLEEIYSQIAVQSGIENVYQFSDVIPFCFQNAFLETLRIPENENSMIPYYGDEITPLIKYENVQISLSNYLGDYDISDISNLLYVFTIATGINGIINYKYVSLNALNDLSLNQNTLPSAGEGFWAKLGSKIRVLSSSTSEPSVAQIGMVKAPDITLWNGKYDFVANGYGLGFIAAVIEISIQKLVEIAKRRA